MPSASAPTDLGGPGLGQRLVVGAAKIVGALLGLRFLGGLLHHLEAPDEHIVVILLVVAAGLVVYALWGAGSRRVTAQGEARYLRLETRPGGRPGKNTQLLSLRVEHFDRLGNRQPPVPVVLQGDSIDGFVNEADEVVVAGRLQGGTLRAKSLFNRTTGATVTARRSSFDRGVYTFQWVLFLGVLLGLPALAIIAGS